MNAIWVHQLFYAVSLGWIDQDKLVLCIACFWGNDITWPQR